MEKWILAFEPAATQAAALGETLQRWADTLPAQQPALTRVELDLYAPAEHAHHTGRDEPPAWHGFVSLWSPEPLPAITTPPGLRAYRFRVREHIARDFVRDWPLGQPGPGIKKLVFWRAAAGLAPERWQRHYREHIPIAFVAHRAWKYRQNIILEKPAGSPFDAVSENWWRDAADLRERFYASAEAEALVAEDTDRFIDKGCAVTVVVAHEIVFDTANAI